MAAADIKDRKSFEAWLTGKPRELCVLMAARSALRVLPLFSGFAGKAKDPRLFADLTARLFRATALARVAALYPTRANDLAASAGSAAADADAAGAAFAAAAARAADADASAAGAYAYAAVSNDADIFQRHDGMSGLSSAPLWRLEPPSWANDAWPALQSALPKGEDWDVWTVWYGDRLNGVNYDEAHELVFATVPLDVWEKGSKAANAWIRAELDRLRLARFANRPGAIEPEINAAGKLDVARRPPTLAYPNNRSERDRLALQAFCQTQASRLLEALRQQKFGNFRDADFIDLLAYYLVDLPSQGREGTFLLADAQAAELRDLAEDLAPILPSRFARGLRDLLAKHDELRAYYVEIPRFDNAASQSQPLPAPPPEPLLRLQEALRNKSPQSVTADLVEQTKQVLRAPPTIELDEDDRRRATSPDIVHQSPRPAGTPSARQRHAHNVATLLAKLNKLGGVSNVKDGVASVGGLHNVDKFITEDVPALIAEILKHWPF